MLTKQKKGRNYMKKMTLLLTLTVTLTAASAMPVQARTVSASCMLKSLMSNTAQTTKCGKETVIKDILKRYGIDLDKYNIPSSCPTQKPEATPAPTAAPTAKPTATPTARPEPIPT